MTELHSSSELESAEPDDYTSEEKISQEVLLPSDDDNDDDLKGRRTALNVLAGLAGLGILVVVTAALWRTPKAAVNIAQQCIVDLDDGAKGAAQGVRRSLVDAGPGKYVQAVSDTYCEDLSASALGRAAPDCALLSPESVATARRRLAPTKSHAKWWHRWGADVESAVAFLLHELDVQEKVQMVRGTGWKTWQAKPGFYVGSILAVPRLDIPSINMQDAGQGFRTTMPAQVGQVTAWPSMLAVSATWDAGLTELVARGIGEEFRAKGANVRKP